MENNHIYKINPNLILKYIICAFLGLLAFFYNCPPALDLGRYYEEANLIDPDMSLFSYSVKVFEENFDFIYYTFFLVLKKIGLPIECSNLFFVTLYYFMSIKIFEFTVKELRIKWCFFVNYLILFAITSVGLFLTLSISRNIAAICFFLIGLYFLLKGKRLFFVFWIISIFTHMGMLIFITIYSLFYFVIPSPKSTYRKIVVLTYLVFSYLFVNYIPFFIGLVLRLPFFDSYSRYLDYSELVVVVNQFSNLGFIEMIFYYNFAITYFFAFFYLKEYSRLIWGSFGVFLFLIGNFNASIMFVQRSLLLLLPFQGVLALFFYKENYNNLPLMFVYILLTILSITLFVGYLYSYRGMGMFF